MVTLPPDAAGDEENDARDPKAAEAPPAVAMSLLDTRKLSEEMSGSWCIEVREGQALSRCMDTMLRMCEHEGAPRPPALPRARPLTPLAPCHSGLDG